MFRPCTVGLILALLTIAPTITAHAQAPYLWLRADSGVVASNGRVATWSDVSGNGYDCTQQDTAKQPMLLSNVKNGPDCVHFDGTDFMKGQPIFPVRSDYTLFLVVRIADVKASNNVLSGTTYAHYFGGNQYMKVLHGNFSTLAVAGIQVQQSLLTLITIRYNESTQWASIWVNGALADSSFVGSNADSTLYLGAYNAAYLLSGDIAEVMLYNSLLSNSACTSTEQSLAEKFALPLPKPVNTTFTSIPASLQLFARNTNNMATLPIEGAISTVGFDSVYVVVTKDKQPWQRQSAPLLYTNGIAPFILSPTIHAERAEYAIDVRIKNATVDSSIAVRDSIVCGDVLFINGQSNSIYGNGRPTTYEYCRTFGLNFSHAYGDTTWTLATAYGNGGGPQVGAWGHRLQKLLSDYAELPICIINGGVGGTTIEQHSRDEREPDNLTTIYGSMLYRARKSGLADKARVMFWYQGESNDGTGYYDKFLELYHNWKKDYAALERIYVVQIRPGCGREYHGVLRETLRTLPDSLPDVVCYSPMGVDGHDGCHYSPAGYDTIGTQLFTIVAHDLYGSTDSVDVGSPNIRSVNYADSTGRSIDIEFTNAVGGLHFTPDVTIGNITAQLADAFFINDSIAAVTNASVQGNTIHLILDSSYRDATLTYLPDRYYISTTTIYEGPWIKNERGYGAYSFHHIPIEMYRPTNVNEESIVTKALRLYPSPAGSTITISYTAPQSGVVTISLFNPLGAMAWNRQFETVEGANSVVLDLSTLQTGMYVCSVALNGHTTNTVVILSR